VSALVAASLAFTSVAEADPVSAPDHTEEAPKRLKGVDLIEHLGAPVPETTSKCPRPTSWGLESGNAIPSKRVTMVPSCPV